MSLSSDFWKELAKLEEEDQVKQSGSTAKKSNGNSSKKKSSVSSEFWKEIVKEDSSVFDRVKTTKKKKKEEDIAPVQKKRTWFDTKLFDDGYDFGDVTKTILGTGGDILENLASGVAGMGEKAVDALAYIAPFVEQGQFYQNGGFNLKTEKLHNQMVEQSKKDIGKFIAKDLYDEEALVKNATKAILGVDTDDYSILGEKSDSLVQSGGQLLATMGLQAVGVPWFLTTGATSFGSEAENAMNQGATYEEAGASAAISAGAEILSEKLSGGILFGGKALDDSVTKLISRSISNKAARTFAKLGLDMVGEGAEEVFSQVASNLGSALYKDESLEELLWSEEAFDEYLESFIGGAALGGVFSGYNAATSNGDYASGLTDNEYKVVDQLYKERVSEAGEKVSQKEKSKIYDQILSEMEKGYISTEDIERILGGETYNAYKNTVDSEDSVLKEFEELGKKQNATLAEQSRYAELKEQVKHIRENSQRSQLRTKLSEDVLGMLEGDRLLESYNERSRRGQAYEADLTQYDSEQQKVIQKAAESGVLNNTRRTHEFVDIIAKISADKGVLFDFTNNAKLKESGFAVEGKTVNGYVTKDGITLNVDSPKAWQSTVGHEITHVLEGTELYKELQKTLFDYAESRNELGGKWSALKELYKDVKDADVNAELTADLVGEYLFTDEDFINNLSTGHRNVFQMIYDEIKYLYKVATAGSKEARELEKVKKAFDKAYRESAKTQTDTKYSLSDPETDKAHSDAVKNRDWETAQRMVDEAAKKAGYTKAVYHGTDARFTVFDTDEESTVREEHAWMADYPDGTIFLAEDYDVAEGYGNRVMEMYLDTSEMKVFEEPDMYAHRAMDDKYGYEVYNYPVIAVKGKDMTIYATLDNTAVKSSLAATYDDKGNLIPLSERFKHHNPDIRYSLSDSEGRQLSSEQAEFFKDSKVKDENGNLLPVYHGSKNSGFNVFQYSKDVQTGTDYGEAYYFTSDRQKASGYSYDVKKDERVAKYQADREALKNRFLETHSEEDKNAFLNYRYEGKKLADLIDDESYNTEGGEVKEVYLNLTNPLIVDAGGKYYYEVYQDYFDKARENGNDGIIVKNVIDNPRGEARPIDTYIAFHPEQIKNVDNVKPTSNPDIRYSLNEEVTEEQNERGLDAKSEVTFSLSKDMEYMDKAISMNVSGKHVSSDAMTNAKVLRERIAGRMNDIKDRGLVALPDDIEGNTYIANSSYDGTEENTTICPRSLASEAFVDAVSEYLGRPLSVKEQIYISQDLQGRSMTPECTYCYVATDRKAYRAFLGEYVAQRDAVLQKVKDNPNADVSRGGELYKEFLNGRKDTNPMYSRFKMWVDAYKNGKPMVDASHLANINKLMGDINSEFGAELKPQIVDAMKYAQSASWAKKRINYVAYNGHILKWKQDRINKLNSHYGLRMYSFSDFHPAFVLENMQMITDASVRGLKMLGYTKDTDFVEIFAPSGMNINISTFGGVQNGVVFENNLIGANWDKAKALREQHPNVGVTFVATDDFMVDWALSQDWIDVVIPFHLVRTGKAVADWFKYNDYTSESSDTKTKDWKKGDKKYIAPTEHNNDKATYLDALAKNHLKPRFERFIDNPNYMKLVNECRQPASVSKPVQPVFNEDAAMVALAKLEANGYYQPIGGSVDRMYEIAGEVADAMTQELAPAMSLSNEGDGFKRYGNFATPATELRYEAPVSELVTENIPTADDSSVVAENATTTPTVSEMETVEFPDDLAPVQTELDELQAEADGIASVMEAYASAGDIEGVNRLLPEYEAIKGRIRELQQPDNERVASLEDADAPPETEKPVSTKSENYDPFSGITVHDITRSTRSYSDRNPGARHFLEEAALGFGYDVNNSTHGERWYNDQLYYESGGEKGFDGTSRHTTSDIEELKDTYGYTWDELGKAADNVAKGDFRSVAAKRVEFLCHKRLMEGYTDVDGRRYPPNQEYITFLNETFAQEQRVSGIDDLLENADAYAPPVEDIAPVAEDSSVAYKTKATDDTMDAPIFESKDPAAVKGQTTMFEPPKPNPKVASVLAEESQIAKEKSGIGRKLVSALVDKGMVFENYSHETGNHEIQAKWNSALSSNTNKKAQYFMENGAAGVPALKDVLTEVNKSGKKEDFFTYMYHAHNVDRMTLEDRFNVPNKTVYGETVTADVSREKVKQYERANPEFKGWAEDFYAITKHMRRLLVDDNIISQETADLWEKMYPHYVPVGRVDANGKNITVPLDTKKTGVNAPIKRAEGGSSDMRPLDVVLAERIEQTYSAIARNRFGIELKNTMGTTVNSQQNMTGVDEAIDTIEAQEDHLLKAGTMSSNPTFTVFENGERVEFEITDDMYDALKPAGGLLGYRNKAIKAVGDARRNLLTQWNPVFALYRNPIKDLQEVAINSQHALKTYMNIPRAITEIATDGDYAAEYHENGGKGNSYFDSRNKKFKAEDNAFKKLFGMPIRAIENAGEFIEEIPRLAEYIASRQEGRSIDRSMLDAARVTTNFAAGGDFTKFLNSHGFTFLNASVQGVSQHARNFREAKEQGLKGYVKVLAKYTVAGLPGILLNNLIWDDDEDYEELNDYVKQNYYVVAKTEDGKFIRIPKGRTAAVMQELMEQMKNLVTGDDEADFGTFYELFMNNIAPNNPIENNILAPFFQTMNNEAWYGGDLVPSRLQKLPAEEQFDESTDSISMWMGEKTGWSPYKINYLLDQYSGGLGDMVLPMLTPEAESGDNSLIGNFLAPWKKEITTDKVLNNKNPGDFYDLRDELEVQSNSKDATEEDSLRSMYMDSVSWEMSDLYARKREIQSSDLPDDEKYEAVREIQEQINALAENALDNYNHVSINGLYSEAGDRRYNKDVESGKWYEIKPNNADGSDNWYYQKEQEVTKGLGISYEDYWNNREEYNFAYDKPGKYAIAQAVGGYDSYMEHYDVLENWQSDRYLAADKEKVKNYINGLDIDYGEKIILYRTVYESKTDKRTYNPEIVSYLNSRDDISYWEMKSILEELGMEVDDEGNVSW